MFSRISGALGCPRGKNQTDSSDGSDTIDSPSWLSQCTRDSSMFVTSCPVLQGVLRNMGLKKCPQSGQFYFDQIPSSTQAAPSSCHMTPWTVVHTSRQRCKLAEKQFKESSNQVTLLVQELRNLASSSTENIPESSSNFAALLVPLLASKPNDDSPDAVDDDDMLILFGAPASIFQLLFHVPSINSEITDLVLELVACSSPYSQELLEQFRPPVGLTTMFSNKKAFSETASRLLQLFQIVTDTSIQATILRILPDLASSLCASNSALNDEDRASLLLQLIEILRTIHVEGIPPSVSAQQDPVTCLLDCLAGFSMNTDLVNQLHTACFELLDRCYTSEAYYTYLPTIFRCLIINGSQVTRHSPEVPKLINRLRRYFVFPTKPLELHGAPVDETLVELLRLAYRFNRILMTEWMRAIDTSSISKQLDASAAELTTIHNQAIQDFLILCVIYSTVDANATASLGSSAAQGPCKDSLTMYSAASSQFLRLQKETDSVLRRLALSDRMFPPPLRTELVNQFLTQFGPTLMSERTRLFSAFSHFLDQLSSVTSTALSIARSQDAVRQLGLSLYIHTFCAPTCTDNLRREIVNRLVRHSLMGLSPSMGRQIANTKGTCLTHTGLVALLRLAQHQPQQLVKFEELLDCLVEHLFRSASTQQASTTDQSYVTVMNHARCIFTIIAWISFCDRDNKPFQEKLLGLLRKQFSNPCLTAKALSIIGAVVVLETICRRQAPCRHELEVASSTQMDDSVVLASQLTHLEADRASTSTTSTTSCLSLRGPGTGLADDLDEVHLAVEDTEDDRTDSVPPADEPRCVTPPSRLLLQLVGLVEHTVSAYPQLKCLWLDELRACFCRLAQLPQTSENLMPLSGKSPRKSLFTIPSSVQAERLISWMGARVMRDFQADFVMDNASLAEYVPQLNLNDPSMCEIAISIGPTWTNYCAELMNPGARIRSLHLPDSKSKNVPTPLILPSQLTLLAEVERIRRGGHLDAIDALLGCPLLLPPSSNPPESEGAIQAHLLDSVKEDPQLLLFIINWCVEAVNVFAPHLLAPLPLSVQQDTCMDSSITSQTGNHSASDRISNSMRLQQSNALTRLAQIAHLRRRLYTCLTRLERQTTVVVECTTDPPNAENLRLADLCLPTVTFEPGRTWDSHPDRTDSFRSLCFTCGIHLSPSRSQAPGRKPSSAATSKCAAKQGAGKSTTRVSKAKRARRDESEIECPVEEDAEGDAELDKSTSSSDNESVCTDSGGQSSKDKKQSTSAGISKMTAGKLVRMKDTNSVSFGLIELTACFRELDLSSLFLGLSTWPWSGTRNIDSNSTQCSGKHPGDQVSTLDWTTLAWLLEDFSSKLTHLSGLRSSSPTGWYAFQRLDQLRPDVRRKYFLRLIPSVYRALQSATEFFVGDGSDPSDELQSSCSSEEECPTSTAVQPSGNKRPTPKAGTFQPCVDLFSGTGLLIPNVICECLQILCILLTGTNNPNNLVIPQPSHTTIECSQVSEDYFRRLARACMQDVDSIEIESFLNNGPVFRDLLDESPMHDADSARRAESDYRSLANDVRAVLEWLLKMSPAGLPHATAAYLHSKLVFRIADIYLGCLTRLRLAAEVCDADCTWFPDLHTYTKSLLDREWNPEVRWKGHTYRESLQGLLAMHLRFRPDTVELIKQSNIGQVASVQSPNLLLDFTRGLILPTVRRYSGQSGERPSSTQSGCWDGYRTLSRQTVDIYCREVMASVLWHMKQLCSVDRSPDNVTTDCLTLACWNECIVIFGLLIDLLVSSSGGRRRGRDEQAAVSETNRLLPSLVPNLLRTGRLFLQGLLKGCMPMLNTLFRHRGVEVVTFLRNTQGLTRFLQRVCTHAKTNRDAQLANQIPATRRCLEIFVYRVKILLSQHQCSDAFWLGTLKNRDLRGVELPDDSEAGSQSQSTSRSVRNASTRRAQPNRISYSPSLPAEEIRGSIDSELDSSDEDLQSNLQSGGSPAEIDLEDEGDEAQDDELIEPSDTESCQL